MNKQTKGSWESRHRGGGYFIVAIALILMWLVEGLMKGMAHI